MKIIIDNKIPYIKGALEPLAEVIYCNAAEINQSTVADADALVVRTRTTCNAQLLKGSKVRFIATATIGFDHIDTHYCQQHHIAWANAPGCNSSAVEQYLAAALLHIAKTTGKPTAEFTVGIVGVGKVGRKVARIANLLGMHTLKNDPPRERIEGKQDFVDIEQIQQKADIISFHTPLNLSGPDATKHLVNQQFIDGCTKKPWIINTCRGEVTHTNTLIEARRANKISGLIIDCWENEPQISEELLNICDIATPHIAGYSQDGKAAATQMAVQALSRFFKLGIDHWLTPYIKHAPNYVIRLDGKGKTTREMQQEVIPQTYDIALDSQRLKADKGQFEHMRNYYHMRREFPYYIIKASRMTPQQTVELMGLGIRVATID